MFGCFFFSANSLKRFFWRLRLILVVYRIYSCWDCWEREKNRIIINIIFILFVYTSWNGLNFAFLTSLVYWHKVHRFVLLNLHCRCFRSQSAHPSRKLKKKKKKYKRFSKSFLFFFNLRNNILHEYKYNGRFLACTKMCSNLERKTECTMSAVSVYISIY